MNWAIKYLMIYIVWSVYPFIELLDYLNTLMDYMATQCFHFAYLKLRFIVPWFHVTEPWVYITFLPKILQFFVLSSDPQFCSIVDWKLAECIKSMAQ